MKQNKKIIGITGGSGSGKSYLSEKLRARGYTVIDADKTAHTVMDTDPGCVAELTAAFGAEIYGGGALDRKRLGEIVWKSPSRLSQLNKITHKYILKSIDNKISAAAADIAFVDGAVLIESGMKCDIMIGVLTGRELRLERIIGRDGITREAAEARLAAQPEDSFYEQNCTFTVRGDSEPDIEYILKRINE